MVDMSTNIREHGDMSTKPLTHAAPAATLLPQSAQHRSSAFGGILNANKPVVGGFLADGRPSSALFYWSHSRFAGDFEFGLHPHQGFEIMTVVLDGANSHYDTATQRWVALRSGDVQVIRSGRGIEHNEKVAEGTRAFQIWFDPGYSDALRRTPSYTDHRADEFGARTEGSAQITDLIGDGGPVHLETEGLSVRRVALPAASTHTLSVGPESLSVVYLVDGEATVGGVDAGANDAVTVVGSSPIEIATTGGADLFVVSLPSAPSYEPVRQR